MSKNKVIINKNHSLRKILIPHISVVDILTHKLCDSVWVHLTRFHLPIRESCSFVCTQISVLHNKAPITTNCSLVKGGFRKKSRKYGVLLHKTSFMALPTCY